MQQTQNKVPWYKRTNRRTLSERIESVQSVNDPLLVADNIQRWSKIFIYVLLAFTSCLSGFAYFKFFEPSFGFFFASLMAISLALVIEFCKNWGLKTSLRIPFFMGWGYIKQEFENTLIWLGPTLLAAITFFVSVYNSTEGSKQLALMLHTENTRSDFSPNTSELDAQIRATQDGMKQSSAIKWHGITTYQAQKSIQKQAGALENLQAQKAKIQDQQRADFERDLQTKENQGKFSANAVFIVGGFIEALQVILIFMLVAAERSLDKTATQKNTVETVPQSQPAPTAPPQHFQQSSQAISANPALNRTPIQFGWDGYGIESSVKNTVPQSAQQKGPPQPGKIAETVPQSPQSISGSDQALRLLKQTLQRELPNFKRGDVKKETVFNRIKSALDETLKILIEPSFNPSSGVFLSTFDYVLLTAFPTICKWGFLYEYEGQYISIFHNHKNFSD